MRSQIQITLIGPNIPTLVPIGASVTYGVNRIPTATVNLGPESLALMCDFEQIRRQPVLLTIQSPDFCIRFNGVIDGLNMAQQPGGIGTSLVLKHQFTFLNEIFPRILGLDASSTNCFAVNAATQISPPAFDPKTKQVNPLALFQSIYGYAAIGMDWSVNIVDFIVNWQKAVITSQLQNPQLLVNPATNWSTRKSALTAALNAADINQQNLGPSVLAFLNQIDTAQCANMQLFPNTPHMIDSIYQIIDSNSQDTLFQSLIRMLSNYHASLIIGNGTAYVVPEAQYLLIPKQNEVSFAEKSNQYNILYPSQYEHFSFSDNGDNTIKGVYMAEQPDSTVNYDIPSGFVNDGYYVDPNPNVFGNVIVRSLPNYATQAATYAGGVGSIGIHKLIGSGSRLVKQPVDYYTYSKNILTCHEAIDTIAVAPYKAVLNQFAQMEYCRMKYGDRGGAIGTYFFNNFAPGAVGSLYTRQPGMYIDFYITSVTHSFSLSEGGGSAHTDISFNGGRMGNATNTGLDNLAMYNYTYADSVNFCSKFINDVSTVLPNAYA